MKRVPLMAKKVDYLSKTTDPLDVDAFYLFAFCGDINVESS